ncbi:RNase adapter RapZ [Desulfobotulus sp. H1]|uniref:RNase adapter RapZ n=1 Tax=Desulfobotulus pelophilus TaxID=2823377 RepID=A0ABT3N6N3_9BACT|nr:RNase adapter RapZ [Desulfobotulus pelophilus]MCW7752821.1 RNase adapter RapZ [Desulfobotulus pelophilus]
MEANGKIIVITGLSGSGKSTAAAALEDAGFYCVDNLPVSLLPKFLELRIHSGSTDFNGLGFIMDIREKSFIESHARIFTEIRNQGWSFQLIFLDTREDVLLDRFSQTRRQHPLAQSSSLLDGIREEILRMSPLKENADHVIDTSETTVHSLKALIMGIAQHCISTDTLRIDLLSFGFKYGLPRNMDLLMDVRFLANPYFNPDLRDLTGEDPAVRDFILFQEETQLFLQKYLDLLDYLIPLYKREGKAYLTLGIGCTGGRHRSVAIARRIFEYLQGRVGQIGISHRDILRQSAFA